MTTDVNVVFLGLKKDMVEIKCCSTGLDFSSAIQITKDYIRWLDMDLSFQNIDEELSNFPSVYGPPGGLFLLARLQGVLVGGVGLRVLENKVCEMKRLFVYEEYKSAVAGRSLCNTLIRRARDMGYEKMRLDTLGRMNAAISLYKSLGFKEIEPYRFNPDPTTRYMELKLRHRCDNSMPVDKNPTTSHSSD